MLYQFGASSEYDPSPKLETIKAPLTAISSADDLINPPELGIMEREIRRVKRGRYILIPISDATRGHALIRRPPPGSNIWRRFWKSPGVDYA